MNNQSELLQKWKSLLKAGDKIVVYGKQQELEVVRDGFKAKLFPYKKGDISFINDSKISIKYEDGICEDFDCNSMAITYIHKYSDIVMIHEIEQSNYCKGVRVHS